MVSRRSVWKWVKRINTEIGREDRNAYMLDYFMRLDKLPNVKFTMHRNWFLVTMVYNDMWGDSNLAVVACGVKKDKREGSSFLELQREIKRLAKRYKVRYTIQGSHIRKKYFKFLKGIGYEVSEMKKEESYG